MIQSLNRRRWLGPQLVLNYCGLVWLSLLPLLSGCYNDPPPALATASPKSGPIPSRAHDGALYFDERYLDSLNVRPRSARIERELAIEWELGRLELAKRTLAHSNVKLTDSVTATGKPGGPLVHYRSNAVLLAEIYRKIDSLKVLEHLPVTAH